MPVEILPLRAGWQFTLTVDQTSRSCPALRQTTLRPRLILLELEISPLRARFLAFTASWYITSNPFNRALLSMETNMPTFIHLIYVSV